MPSFVRIMRCISKAVVKYGPEAATKAIAGEAFWVLVKAAYDNYRNEADADFSRDMDTLATAPRDEVQNAAVHIAEEESKDQPPGAKQGMEDCLNVAVNELKVRRKEMTLKVLARHGVVCEGTTIELMEDARPADAQSLDPNVFKARIGNIYSQKSVVWAYDNNPYSLTALSILLDQYGLSWVRPKTFELWQIVGDQESMWERAEKLRWVGLVSANE